MDLLMKNRVLTAGVILLVLLNVATLGTLWFHSGGIPRSGPAGRGGPGEFMQGRLQFNEAQRKQFEVLRSAYQHESEGFASRLKAARLSLYDEIRSGRSSEDVLARLTGEVGALQSQLELLTMRHFRSVRELCDEQQRTRFDELMRDVFERTPGEPPPPGAPPEGRPGGPGAPPGGGTPLPPPEGGLPGEEPPR